MEEMRKLKVMVYEDYIDAVVRSLGQVGIVQFIDMCEKFEEWKGVLVPYTGSIEINEKCSSLLSRIGDAFESLHIKLDDLPAVEIPITKEPIEKVLSGVEEEFAKLRIDETRIYALASRIDEIIEDLGIKPDQLDVEDALKHYEEKTLELIEFELTEIEKTIETIGLSDHHLLDLNHHW